MRLCSLCFLSSHYLLIPFLVTHLKSRLYIGSTEIFSSFLHSQQYFHLTKLKSQLSAQQALATFAFTQQKKRAEKSLPLGNPQAGVVGSREASVPSLPLPCLSVSCGYGRECEYPGSKSNQQHDLFGGGKRREN